MLRRIGTVQQSFNRRDKVIGNGAAQAAIRKLDNVFFLTSGVTTAAQNLTINADVTKFVNDQRQAFIFNGFNHMTDQTGFAGTKKASDNGCRDSSHGSFLFLQCNW